MALVTTPNKSDGCWLKCQNRNKCSDVSGLCSSSVECFFMNCATIPGIEYLLTRDMQPRGLIADFHLILSSRARAKDSFQILNSMPGIAAQLITNNPLMKGTVPKRLGICYDFGTFINIHHSYLILSTVRSSLLKYLQFPNCNYLLY